MKLCIFIVVIAATSLAGLLDAQVHAPKIGIARYPDGTARAVYGLENNFVTGEQTLTSVQALSFSGVGGLVARSSRIQLISAAGVILGEYDSGEKHPLLNIDGDLATAIAYLPAEQVLLHWNGKSFIPVQLSTGGLFGTVTSAELLNAHEAKLLVTTSDGNVSELTVSLDTGETTSVKLLPGIKGPAFLYRPFVLFQDKKGIEVEASNGTRRIVALPTGTVLPGDLVMERMGSEWLQLFSEKTKQSWALHLNSTVSELAELPAPAHQSQLRGGK